VGLPVQPAIPGYQPRRQGADGGWTWPVKGNMEAPLRGWAMGNMEVSTIERLGNGQQGSTIERLGNGKHGSTIQRLGNG
jgi:hypothetical protein